MCEELKPGKFLGRRLASVQVFESTFIETEYTGGLPPHSHKAPYFAFVINGVYRLSTVSQSDIWKPHTSGYHPGGAEPHWTVALNMPVRTFLFEPSKRLIQIGREFGVPLERPTHSPGGSLSLVLARAYEEFSKQDDVTPLSLEGLALEALGALRRAEGAYRRPPRWLERVREQLQTSFDQPLRFGQLATVAGVHQVELAQTFRRFYGCTAGDYLRRTRIEAACRQLRHSEASLAEIALNCGFSSQSHFSTAFRKIMGVTPGAYRQQVRR